MSNLPDTEASTPEFSHPVALSDIPGDGTYDFSLEGDADSYARLATLFGAHSVAKLRFTGTLSYDKTNRLVLDADLGVTVTQTCVVTLAPVKTRIDERVRRYFVADYGIDEGEYQIKVDGEEDIELLTDPIDVGILATEAIALSLPTYPRAQGAELSETRFTAPGLAPLTDADLKPFASLAALKEKMKDTD